MASGSLLMGLADLNLAPENDVRGIIAPQLSDIVETSLDYACNASIDDETSFYTIEGMSGRRYRCFINTLVKTLGYTAMGARYLEVGSWLGSTLCSAIHNNTVRAIGIENWSVVYSDFDKGNPRPLFYNNLTKFKTSGANVDMGEFDYRDVDYRKLGLEGLFNIFLFDGPHSYNHQYIGLMLALKALAQEFVFIVDDWNWDLVREATYDSIHDGRLKIVYKNEIRTTLDGSYTKSDGRHSDWHNGYFISVLRQ